MHRFVLTCLIFLLFVASIFSQAQLEKAIAALKNDPTLAHGSLSVSVIDVKSGKLLASVNPKQSLTPASSLKVITTAAALSILKEDFKFKTDLEFDGSIDQYGTLNGNLYIKGNGDPTLGSENFTATKPLDEVMNIFFKALIDVGIKKINGQIIGDGSFFGSQGTGRTWAYEDLGNYYGASALGLNIQENMYFVELQQKNEIGSKPIINSVTPSIPNLVLVNELQSAEKGTGDNAYIFGSPYTYVAFVRGTIPVGKGKFVIKGSIPDPAFFTAHYLMQYLQQKGIETTGLATSLFELSLQEVQNTKRKTFFTLESPSLREIVKEANLKSVNLYCEAMLRMLGKQVKGSGTPDEGLVVVKNFWKDKGLNLDGFFMEDGSGLSPYNAITSFQLASAIQIIEKDKGISNAFKQSLPVAGKSGALKYRLKGTFAENNLCAKSGALNRVRSYTGLAKNKSGATIAFCMIVNNYTGSSGKILLRMEKIMESICEQ